VADTHIHSPLKAYIRQEKARLQEEWDREALATGQDRNARWGPYHVATVLGQALAKLQELQEKSDVVLKGFVQNQLLVFRPDEHHTFQLIDTCTAAWTQKVERSPPGRGITPKSAGDRVWAWSKFQHWGEMGGPEEPDWTQLDKIGNWLEQNEDPPEAPEDWLLLDCRFEDLQFTEEQLRMMRPPEERLQDLPPVRRGLKEQFEAKARVEKRQEKTSRTDGPASSSAATQRRPVRSSSRGSRSLAPSRT
jgi:hypothetical protein